MSQLMALLVVEVVKSYYFSYLFSFSYIINLLVFWPAQCNSRREDEQKTQLNPFQHQSHIWL